jgi:sterol desaturase/sphingolipid hydroxylase (fatty acid hydroxylase superfamily)
MISAVKQFWQPKLINSKLINIVALVAMMLGFEAAVRLLRVTLEFLGTLNIPLDLREILSRFAAFALISTPLVLAERFAPGTPQPRNYWPGIKVWTLYLILTHFWSKVVVATTTALHIKPLFNWDATGNHDLSVAIALLLPVMIFDAFYYWVHRAQHEFPVLWRFHQVHHAIVDMNCINSYSHISEELLFVFYGIIPPALLFKIDAPQVFMLSAFIAVWVRYIHSDTAINFGRLNVIFADNVHHRLHHSSDERHFNKNYAAFLPIWDQIFGTYHKPSRRLIAVGCQSSLPASEQPGFLTSLRSGSFRTLFKSTFTLIKRRVRT